MELSAQTRENLGKKLRALRESGFIPAEFYGHGMKNEHLSVSMADFKKVYKEAGENTVVTLSVGTTKLPSLIYSVTEDPLSGEVIHVDFYGVRMDEKITANVPLEFVGESPVTKDKSGVLNRNLEEVEVESLPANLPHSFTVDLSALIAVGQTIYVKDLKAPKGVEILTDGELSVAGIAEARAEEVAPVAPVDLGEVKVESEEKKAERDAAKATEEKE